MYTVETLQGHELNISTGDEVFKAANKRYASTTQQLPPSGCESPSLILYTSTLVM